MRNPRLASTALAATVCLTLGALAPVSVAAQSQLTQSQLAQAQPPAPPTGQAPAPAAPAAPSVPKPYKPVAVKLPEPVKDASFTAFRKQLATIAQKKDRAGLARVIAKNFFWIPDDKDAADKSKPGIENLAKAIGLEGKDAPGWELLASYADDPTADKDSDRAGVICAPGDPTFDDKAAEALATETETDPPIGAIRSRAESRCVGADQERPGAGEARSPPRAHLRRRIAGSRRSGRHAARRDAVRQGGFRSDRIDSSHSPATISATSRKATPGRSRA